MTTAFVTPVRRVEISEHKHWIEAHEPGSGRLLGVAARNRGFDEEWIGWLVTILGDHCEVVETRAQARDLLEGLAAMALEAVTPDAQAS